MTNPILLIVDDQPANIQMLATILQDNYQIKVTTNGKDCLKIANNSPQPDLILLDIEMPDMNGYEVLRQLRASQVTIDIPVIFVTAKVDYDDEEMGLELGAVDYITKPIHPAIVKVRVKNQIMIKHQKDQLIQMALHDQLTKLYNRHYLMETARLKIAKSLRHKVPVSIAIMDLDHFKLINDNHGHEIGDKVLIAIGELLLGHTRKEDITARIGGEEFVIIFDHCNQIDVEVKANHLREKIEQLKPQQLNITASIGVSQLDFNGETLEQLLNRADKALYQAKKQGRNKVIAI
ncbi:diguanylate cyclase [Aliikangiella sp. IMCC44359]|uniref:diguanylate cyclase n=1 Tax=Aliikangiella sp. IMCC44359 TaxID=3459125 RepID=UPI00403B03F2